MSKISTKETYYLGTRYSGGMYKDIMQRFIRSAKGNKFQMIITRHNTDLHISNYPFISYHTKIFKL